MRRRLAIWGHCIGQDIRNRTLEEDDCTDRGRHGDYNTRGRRNLARINMIVTLKGRAVREMLSEGQENSSWIERPQK